MPTLGVPELLIILVIVIIFFGVGRISEIGGAMGKGIREFRKASEGGYDEKPAGPPNASGPQNPSGE
jgi:sec-independent protein translocase protein TatA